MPARLARPILVAALAIATTAACSTQASSSALSEAPVATGDGGTSVTSVVLRNGVRCAVMDAPNSSALTCAWDGPRAPASDRDPTGDRGTTITVARLPDGTECAVMDARQGSGLSCAGMR